METGNYNWYNDYMYLFRARYPWVQRGQDINSISSVEGGIFGSTNYFDNSHAMFGFRVVAA